MSPGTDLLDRLEARPGASLVVAFSGGLDSTVLLHALSAQGPAGLRSCHVHHGLQEAADTWAKHCAVQAAALGVPHQTLHVTIDPQDPAGPEAAAREARYAALRTTIGAGEVLVTAHHRDDQAETVLLRLLRGSGLRGISAIHALTPFGDGLLWRPFLDVPRAELIDHARRHRLPWIEDPHNIDPRYARSWLRSEVLPLLRRRYPQTDAALAQAARHAAETVELTDALATIDLAHPDHHDGCLSVARLRGMRPARRHNLLRHWLQQQAFAVPGTATLERIDTEVLAAAADAEPRLGWAGCELRRYRDALHALAPLPPPPGPDWRGEWSEGARLDLPLGCGSLIANRPPPTPLTVRFIAAGERWRPAPKAASRSFKNLFQEAGVPPWQRLRTPLLECDGTPALVPALKLASAVAAGWSAAGWRVEWQPTAPPGSR